MSTTMKSAQEKFNKVDTFQKFKDKASEMGEEISQKAHDVKDKALDIQENIASYVNENPVKTAGFALLAGVVLGLIFKKSKKA